MRVALYSDLHLEFIEEDEGAVEDWRKGLPEVWGAERDVTVLAGDVHLGRHGEAFIRTMLELGDVVYLLGNHEFYGYDIDEIRSFWRGFEATGAGGRNRFHFLDDGAVSLYDDGREIVFVGGTMWTDFGAGHGAMKFAHRHMTDYHAIDYKGKSFTPRDAIELNGRTRSAIDDVLRGAPDRAAEGVSFVVATHHAPSFRSRNSERYGTTELDPAYCSDMDRYIEDHPEVKYWFHGHTHKCVDYRIGSTRIVSNQRGYPHERCVGYNPDPIFEI